MVIPLVRTRTRFLAATLLLLAANHPAAGQGLALDLVEQTASLVRPVAVAHAGDGSGRLFVAQLSGEVRILDGGTLLATPFLDLSGLVTCCGELGLLGLAFHPDYATNGELFVNYIRSAPGQQTVVARYTVSADDPDLADPGSAEILLVLDQPELNHNAGQLAFGPDGHLYVSTGDGGGPGDPSENAQDLATLHGAVLRLDVDSPPGVGLAYAVPASNPFVGTAGARGEIWAYGLRNPWRFSFDRGTGDLWIADVGETLWEEVDHQPAASPGGENYGWDCREGAHPFADPNGDMNASCPAGPFTEPLFEYEQVEGRCSVTGGYVYRGDLEPRLRGVYLYADFCTGEVFGTVPRCNQPVQTRRLYDAPFFIPAFGEDEAGELYVTQYVGNATATSRLHLVGLAPGSNGPDLQVTPSSVDFGTLEVGAKPTRVVTLRNVNPGPEALTVSALSVPPGFSVDPGAGPSPCVVEHRCLLPGTSCTVAVGSTAAGPGSYGGDLVYDGNFLAETLSVSAEVVPCSTSEEVTVSGVTVTGGESHSACDTLTAGPSVEVTTTGDLQLCAGTRVVLRDGFAVLEGGRLAVRSTSC